MLRACKILCLCAICGFGADVAFIESKPDGLARDFYIYEALQGDISPKDALKLFSLISRKSPKIINAFNGKIPPENLPREMQCARLSYAELLKKDDSCFNAGFRLDYALNHKISAKTLARIKNANVVRHIKMLQSKNALESLLKGSGKDFSDVYFAISHKSQIFNAAPKNPKILSNKNYGKALYHLIISQKYPKFTKALLKANIVGVNDWSAFALGLNELKNGSKAKARMYFAAAAKSATDTLLRDRAVFWQYKIANDKAILKTLAQSKSFNLYSLYATRILKSAPNYDIIAMNSPIFSALDDTKSPFHISDPFEWQVISENLAAIKDKDALLALARLFYYKDTLPHFVHILERYYGFTKKFFIAPYDDFALGDVDKPLLYAIARQESRFIPSVVSSSYALGMLQIMPFNIANFADAMGEKNIKKEDMFKPEVALRFGAYYLNYLAKEFPHPLFVSYAYNGGPSFMRKFLSDARNFRKANAYEPYLSMEFIPYEESRIYGMKVMANYVMYNHLNGVEIDIDKWLKEALR